MKILSLIAAGGLILAFAAATHAHPAPADLSAQVADAERAFARTMAQRDHAAFVKFLADEATFLSGTDVRSGRDAVAEQWKAYFTAAEPPFSWEPETVAVLESGDLALSTGPVWNSAGQRVSTFTSIWRQEAPGVWRIVFDKGNRYCE